VQGDWLYDEFVGGGYISYLGMEPGNPPSVQVAGSPREAASESEGSAGTALQPSSPNAILLQPVPPPPPGQSLPIQRIPSKAPASAAPDPFQRLAPGLR
jgi:hypothetical protein